MGNPKSAIAQYVESQAIDLLVLGAYGHNRIRHLVIGSTTAQILRSSPIPVLRFPLKGASATPIYNRILG